MIIYLVKNSVNGKSYVGQTIKPLKARWLQHLRDARNGSHYELHRAIRECGERSFECRVLAKADSTDQLKVLEEVHIREHNALSPNGYNVYRSGRDCELVREKIGIAHTGRKASIEQRVKTSNAMKGKKKGPQSPEHIANHAAAIRGRKHPPRSAEWSARIAAAKREWWRTKKLNQVS
jgi:group I intron endonuclease